MAAIPLPEGNNASETIRRLKAIDAEFFAMNAVSGTLGDLIVTGDITLGPGGTITVGDVVSTNYNGSGGTPNGSATAGYKLHESSGSGEFGGKLYANELHADGAFLTSLKAANITVGVITGSQVGNEEIEIVNEASPVFVDAGWQRNTLQTWNSTPQQVAADAITVPSWVGTLSVAATMNAHTSVLNPTTESMKAWLDIAGVTGDVVELDLQNKIYTNLFTQSANLITSPGSSVVVDTYGMTGSISVPGIVIHQQYTATGTR